MTDIVERLRKVEALGGVVEDFPQVLGKGDWGWVTCRICGEGAAEIERLRATIAQLRAVAGAVSVEGHSYADIRKSLRLMAQSANTGSTDAA